MPLVAYADSSSDDDDDDDSRANTSNHGPPTSPPRKRRRTHSPSQVKAAPPLPPLPSTFRDLYATNTRTSTKDDPALHAGRKRQVPHIQGNWPTHIFIEWYPSPAEASILAALITSVTPSSPATTAHQIHTSLTSDLGVPLPLHISLSAPLILRTEQRTAFLTAARRAIHHACPHGCFRVALRGLDWASNAEGSRWFLAQRVTRPDGDELNLLLRECNHVAAEFGLARLYENGDEDDAHGKDADDKIAGDWSSRFHFSIGWTLTPPGGSEQDGQIWPAQVDGEKLKAAQGITVPVDAVKVKIGNVVTPIGLDDKAA